MKIFAYEVRFDELEYMNRMKSNDIIIDYTNDLLTLDNVEQCKGYDAVTFLANSKIDKHILDKFNEYNIKFIATRSVGFNHIDLEYAKSLGIRTCNASYPSTSVAEFTVMLMIMVLRNYKQSLYRGNVNDYSLLGLGGKTLESQKVGIIGTGKIGANVCKLLKGFGCEIQAYDPYINESIKEFVTYTSLEEIYKTSDIISLHVPYTNDNHHLISDKEISMMKDGVIIINAARGELIDNNALIKGIESLKIGGLGLDSIEGEHGIFHFNHKTSILKNKEIAYLKQFPNVTITPHYAFYTDEATKYMVEIALKGLISFITTNKCDYEL